MDEIRFNLLRTRYACPDCGQELPVELAVFGLDVSMLLPETMRMFEDHVLEHPELHPNFVTATD